MPGLAASSVLHVSLVLLAVIASVSPAWAQNSEQADELRLKAAFVYRFPQFVEWPEDVLNGAQTLDICVASPNPFGATLEQLVEGESLDGRQLNVRHLRRNAPADTCRVLYLPGEAVISYLERVADAPVLTISDTPQFLDLGGIIRLTVIDRRVRFEVNASAAERAGLRLSSQLLRLAVAVRGME